MKVRLIALIFFSISFFSFSQTEPKNFDFKKTEISEKTQAQVGRDFYFVSFYVKGIKTASQRKALSQFFNANPNFKRVSIASYNEFHGFVKNTVHASDVQSLLKSQGVDMVISKEKFILPDDYCSLPHPNKK
jgi:hypothetical protein